MKKIFFITFCLIIFVGCIDEWRPERHIIKCVDGTDTLIYAPNNNLILCKKDTMLYYWIFELDDAYCNNESSNKHVLFVDENMENIEGFFVINSIIEDSVIFNLQTVFCFKNDSNGWSSNYFIPQKVEYDFVETYDKLEKRHSDFLSKKRDIMSRKSEFEYENKEKRKVYSVKKHGF